MLFVSDVEIPQKLNLFAGMMKAACDLDGWALRKDGSYVCFSEHESEFWTLLNINGCLDYARQHVKDAQVPHILSDRLGVMWMAEPVYDNGEFDFFVIFGPFFNSNLSPKAFESILRNMNLSYDLTRQVMDVFNKVPVINETSLYRYAKMLHYCMSGATLSESDIRYQNNEDPDWEAAFSDQDPSIVSEKGKMLEAMLRQTIREGNINCDDILTQARAVALTVHYNTGIPLRDERNLVIINTALCSRAAMEGGLSSKIAQKLEETYVKKAEFAEGVAQLANLNREMMIDFINMVHKCKVQAQMSSSIQECMLFVHSNLTKPFTLKDMARSVGYTEYYLTRKFKNETGQDLADYIRKARLEQAKILLRTTNQTVQAISEQLQFSTRNYFTRVFRNELGMTPAQYRAENQ